MALRLITGPTVEPVSLAEAKAHLRVDVDADDGLIGALIATARAHIEQIARPQLAMITQTWDKIFDDWPATVFELRPWPLQAVTSISYTTAAGVTTTWSSANYVIDTASEPGRVALVDGVSWPSVTLRRLNGVAIRFTAGYGASGAAVPLALRQAILMLVGHWYENREAFTIGQGFTSTATPMAVDALIRPWRREV